MSKNFEPQKLSEFAQSYGFHYDRIDAAALVDDVLSEMERGLGGAPSSLPMIPTYISPVSKITPLKTVIALDAGGTNLRAALVKFDENGKAIVEGSRKIPMPGTGGRGPVSADAFFDEFAAITAPLIEEARDRIEGIGICFSYPMEITKDADGIPLAFSKEVNAPEVIGKPIGSGLREALARRNVPLPNRVVLLNDTVAALLSGLSGMPDYGYSYGLEAGPVIGFILGTGYNTAYPEKNIPKIGFNSADCPQIVVTECGSCAHPYMGLLDNEFDSTTKTPGAYTLEKTVSGAYLGPLSFHILRQAYKDGLFSFNRAEEFFSRPSMQTREFDEFLHDPLARKGSIGELFGSDELDAIRSIVYLAEIITQRGALLAAVALAATVEKAVAGNNPVTDPFTPVRIAVEGTSFALCKGMRTALESSLHVILNRHRPCACIIELMEQASLLGAAVAALSPDK